MWLDDHLVKPSDVQSALNAAIPGAAQDPVGVAHLVAQRWEDEIHQALVQAGDMPGVRKPPAEVLKRKQDGHIYWSPNPAPPTIGNAQLPPAPVEWLQGFLDFYGVDAADDGGGAQCVFNGTPTSMAEVASTAQSQAGLASYAPNGGELALVRKMAEARRVAKASGSIVDRIRRKVAAKGDLSDELATLFQLDMRSLLAALDQLSQQEIDAILDARKGALGNRGSAALLLVQGSWGDQFKQAFAKLGSADQAVLLERLPKERWKEFGVDPASSSQESGDNASTQIGVQAGVGFVKHYNLATGSGPGTEEWITQFVGAVTRQLHGKDKSGVELQGDVQAQYSLSTGQWVLSVGGQGSYVFALPANLQLSFWGQFMHGVNPKDTNQIQDALSAGSQFTWQPKDWLQLSAQIGAGPTFQKGGGPNTFDINGLIVVTIAK